MGTRGRGDALGARLGHVPRRDARRDDGLACCVRKDWRAPPACGALLPAKPSFVYPVPQSMTTAGRDMAAGGGTLLLRRLSTAADGTRPIPQKSIALK